MQSNGFRFGGTQIEIERLSPALIERVNRALRTGTVDGERVPEQVLRERCSDCTPDGLVGYGYYASACPHRMGWLAYIAAAEGIPVSVHKPSLISAVA